MMEEIFAAVCGTCKRYKTPKFRYFNSRMGGNPVKRSEYELKRDITKYVDVSFPVYSQEGRMFADGSLFLMIVKSSGCSLVVRDETNAQGDLYAMIEGILKIWPFLVISYMIAATFGTLAWFIVSVLVEVI